MTNPHLLVNRLITGLSMSRDEFLRAWDDTPELKNAELIEGIVYVPSPVGSTHAEFDFIIHHWLAAYCDHDRRYRGGANATWLMLESAPQPDSHLRLLPEFGGHSKEHQGRFTGAPELAVEICETSREVDFGPKLALYQRAGVREYITVETLLPRVQWRVLDNGSYRTLDPDNQGILRSEFFPGLWLDTKALLTRDSAALIACLQSGIASTTR
ncbi:MAG: Uma2 family endonuclease [Bryobacteraceae bacterium]